MKRTTIVDGRELLGVWVMHEHQTRFDTSIIFGVYDNSAYIVAHGDNVQKFPFSPSGCGEALAAFNDEAVMDMMARIPD